MEEAGSEKKEQSAEKTKQEKNTEPKQVRDEQQRLTASAHVNKQVLLLQTKPLFSRCCAVEIYCWKSDFFKIASIVIFLLMHNTLSKLWGSHMETLLTSKHFQCPRADMERQYSTFSVFVKGNLKGSLSLDR